MYFEHKVIVKLKCWRKNSFYIQVQPQNNKMHQNFFGKKLNWNKTLTLTALQNNDYFKGNLIYNSVFPLNQALLYCLHNEKYTILNHASCLFVSSLDHKIHIFAQIMKSKCCKIFMQWSKFKDTCLITLFVYFTILCGHKNTQLSFIF